MESQVWLLYGSKGWVAGHFMEAIGDRNVTVVPGTARCDDYDAVQKEVESVNPDRVISMIGRTSGPGFSTIDYLEQPGKLVENLRDNLYGPMVLEAATRSLNIHFTYLGTGCIFTSNGKSTVDQVFNEKDDPNFTGSGYSTVKGFTDRLMRMDRSANHTLNVRIRMPISEDRHPKSLLTKILGYTRVCDSGVNSMTVFKDLMPVLVDHIIRGETGTLHLVNPGPMSHIDILRIYQEEVDPDFQYQVMSEEEQSKILLAGRSKCVINSSRMEELGVPRLEDSVRRIFRGWSTSK